MKILSFVFAALAALGLSTPASAHFLMLYTPEIALAESSDLDMRMVFTHPATAGQMMDMGGIGEFYALHKRGDSEQKKIDLKQYAKEITWKNPGSSAPAFSAMIPRKEVRSTGDYTFVLVPGYYHNSEDKYYMQQITKMVLNVGGVPGNWADPVGLPTEIVPLAKPYGLWTGNVFKAQVLSAGKPVPFTTVEVEYMNRKPDLANNSMPDTGAVTYPQPEDAFIIQPIKTDANGYFVYGLPRAGWWGFAATDVGPNKEYKGEKLYQDAVIWVKAVDMK